MATTITYASALSDMREFAIAHGYDNSAVIEKVDALIFQKTSKTRKKSAARVENERLAAIVAAAMLKKGVFDIPSRWVAENVPEVTSARRAVAILNAGVDMGIITRRSHKKTATRSEFRYTAVKVSKA